MKHARAWHDWDTDDNDDFDVDENGWVTSLLPGQTAGTVFLVKSADSPIFYDRMIVTYEGTGTIEYDGSAAKIDAESSLGRDVVQVGQGNHLMRITATDPSDYIRNISIVPEQLEADFDDGEIFNPAWIERIGVFRAVRFMGWMNTTDSEQSEWADRPREDDYVWSQKGVPLEVMIELANKIGADPWFSLPHLATEEYIREFAIVVKNQLSGSRTAYVEHSNEVWNWQFRQAQYADAAGRQRWGDHADAFMQWHGMRTAIICDIWKQEVFSDSQDRVHCVFATQAGWQGLENSALNCPLWVAEEAGRDACYAHGIDSIAITGYFSGCLASNDHADLIQSWFTDADQGMAKGMSQLKDAGMFECDQSVSANRDTYAYFKAVADDHGLNMVAYEGGQHVTGNGYNMQDDQDFIDFHVELNRHPEMKDRYQENLNLWKDEGGSLFMHYVDIGEPSKWGSWGGLEYLAQESSPKWEAITEFNRQDCWWPGC